MRLHLIESDQRHLQTAECAFASLLFHASLIWLAVGVIDGAQVLTGREPIAVPFVLLPPERREAPPAGQTASFQVGQPGGYYAEGAVLDGAGSGTRTGGRPYLRQRPGERSSAFGLAPLGHPARLSDSVFTMLEVERMVERYEGSAAPVYPPKLSALGKEGHVQATFVVDTTGAVDMASVRVLESDDPLFTESVRTALGAMRFRPATRGGRPVRQLVQQRFNFRIASPPQGTLQIS
ncbi:MAG TPA: energy transducer TonB [Gemmatimonadales bacterium]|nr:energy transducer TonB [Gemmatimonadales bacterium]